MEGENHEKYFGVADFIVFPALLLLSAAIGAFFACKDKKDKSMDTYYYADRNISPFAVAMSMAVSFVSAITVIGFPVETYFYGIVFLWFIVATAFAAVISAIYYIPLIYRLKLKTIYEYLELRYNKYIRKLCSGVVLLETLFYMGITVYLPALALDAVTPLGLKWTIALTSLICTFYTTVGGMKAVIWTDVLQGFIMIFGSLALFVRTVILVGGLQNMAEAVERGGRNNFFTFDTDPRIRSSAMTMFFGMLIASLGSSCCSQVYAQRYLSCKSEGDAKKASLIRIIPYAMFMLLAAANGLAMYAYYENCDPNSAGFIHNHDQTTPRLAVEAFQDLPGMAGLFVSAAYSGTLSTVSSGINSLAAISTEDFIAPRWPKLSTSRKLFVSKCLSVLFGVLVMCVAFIVSIMQSTVIQISLTVAGIVVGPIFSAYTMGVFVPWTNSIGVLTGMIVGWTMSLWVSISAILYSPAPEFRQSLPLSTDGCNFTTTHSPLNITLNSTVNVTWYGTATTAQSDEYRPPLADTLYSMSPFLYGPFGFSIACFVMITVSLLTGINEASEANPELFVPLLDNKNVFPKCAIKFFRLGVPERKGKCEEVNDILLSSKKEEQVKNDLSDLNS